MGFAVVWSRQEQHWLSSSFPVTFKFRIMLAPREPPYYAGRERSGRRPYFKFSPPENWKLGKLGMEKEGETRNFASYFSPMSARVLTASFFLSPSLLQVGNKKCYSLIPPSFLASPPSQHKEAKLSELHYSLGTTVLHKTRRAPKKSPKGMAFTNIKRISEKKRRRNWITVPSNKGRMKLFLLHFRN